MGYGGYGSGAGGSGRPRRRDPAQPAHHHHRGRGAGPVRHPHPHPPDQPLRDHLLLHAGPVDHPPRDLPRGGGPGLRRRHRQAGRTADPQPGQAHRPGGDHPGAGRPLALRPGRLRLGQAGPGQHQPAAQPAQPHGHRLAGGTADQLRPGRPVRAGLSWRSRPWPSARSSTPAGTTHRASASQILFIGGIANIVLGIFNLIPCPPLDGAAVLERFIPARMLPEYYRIQPR